MGRPRRHGRMNGGTTAAKRSFPDPDPPGPAPSVSCGPGGIRVGASSAPTAEGVRKAGECVPRRTVGRWLALARAPIAAMSVAAKVRSLSTASSRVRRPRCRDHGRDREPVTVLRKPPVSIRIACRPPISGTASSRPATRERPPSGWTTSTSTREQSLTEFFCQELLTYPFTVPMIQANLMA